MVVAAAARERLVAQHLALVHLYRPLRQEEPFTLTDVCGVPATEAIPGPYTCYGVANRRRLECVLRGNRADDTAGGLGDRGHEPVPFVEPAQELALLAAVTHEQQQTAIVAISASTTLTASSSRATRSAKNS